MNQKETVFNAFQGATNEGLTGTAHTAFVIDQIACDLTSGECAHSKGPITDEKEARKYAGALLSNWKKKDTRLSGGVAYVPATPRGPQVKDGLLKQLNGNLKSLKAHGVEDMDLITRVEAAIATRREELAAAKGIAKVQPIEDAMAELAALGIAV